MKEVVTTREYYQKLYPYDQLVTWLTSQGHALERFEFAIEGRSTDGAKIYKRYVVATSAESLRRQVGAFTGIRAFHIGGIYPEVCDRKSAPTERMFSVDIDLTDYDFLELKDASGDVSAALCDKAYPVAAFALFVLRHLLEHAFGFQRILCCYSGRRGVHLHVMDPVALQLDNEGRSAVAAFLNVNLTKDKTEDGKPKRVMPSVRKLAAMYGLMDAVMDAFTRSLVGEMDLFEDCNSRLKFLERLDLTHWSLASLAAEVVDEDSGPDAWALIRTRVLSAGVSWFEERLHETVLAYLWPRMDEKVSTSLNHCIKAPFCAHASSRRVAIALPKASYTNWDPANAPSLDAWNKDAWQRAQEALAPRSTPEPEEEAVEDMEDVVPRSVPRPLPPPRKLTFKRKRSPLVPDTTG